MSFWWLTEAIPISATALIPIVVYPLLGIMKAKDVSTSYGDHHIFIFMGGFFLARAMQKWNLHERIALYIIKVVGVNAKGIILGILIATAFISMWISNTATTMMMMPIGIAIILHTQKMVEEEDEDDREIREGKLSNFSSAMMLGISYASSIGGMATLIGTPPNIIFASQIRTLFPGSPEIGFFQWMMIGVPLMIFFLPLTWYYLTHIAIPVRMKDIPGGKGIIDDQIRGLGRMGKGERYTLIIFIFTALGWIFRNNIEIGDFVIPGWSNLLSLEEYVQDSTVAILASILLFIIPINLKEGKFVLDWEWAKGIEWGILILFGGGIALASGVEKTGLAQWIGGLLSGIKGLHVIVMIFLICLMMTFLSEIASNTAIAIIFMPILGATAIAIQADPILLMLPAAVSASCGFMLPVATPPNTIVFGSGYLTVPTMAKAGFGMNLIGIFLITFFIYIIAVPVFGISLSGLPSWAK
jgi:sodium-dependent dicarboxylate transporter 2/3/5